MGIRAVICLSLFIYFYLFREYLSGFFCYHCVSIDITFNFICMMIHFIVELMYIGPQITLKISAWMAKNLKALKSNISLTKALIIMGFSPLS